MRRILWFHSLRISVVSLGLVFGFVCHGAAGDENWDSAFGLPGADYSGAGCFAFRGNELFVGGTFTSIGGVSATNIAKFDGTNWSGVGGGMTGQYNFVGSMALVGGDLIVGGFFAFAGQVPANNIARWDGTNWHALGSGVNSVIFALATDGTNLYAGGHFTTAGGTPASKIARWDGTNWSSLGAGIIPVNEGGVQVGAVDSLWIQDGQVFAGGRFRNAGGVGATNIARWDGANWYALGSGLRYFNGPGAENGAVRTLVASGTNLYAGGAFRFADTISAINVARWDGSFWFPVGGGVNDSLSVLSLALNGPDLYAGGAFQAIGGIAANKIAKWDGTSWSNLGSGLGHDGVRCLLSTGAELYVGGYFPTAGGKPANNMALWHIPHSLSVTRSGENVALSWPATGSNFVLEAKESVGQPNWSVVPASPVLAGDELRVTNQINSPSRLFRLRRK